MIFGLSWRVKATSGPLRCASYTESHMDGVSPKVRENLLAGESVVLT